MRWPRDDAKLDRVRALMADHDLDALVVRAPDDVLSTGTVAGVAGFKSEEERRRLYLKPGDVIEAEIERIGVLRNPVISWAEGHPDG